MEKVIKEKLHTRKIIAATCFSTAVNRNYCYYIYLNKDDMEKQFFKFEVPAEVRWAYSDELKICRDIAEMGITANLHMTEKYHAELDEIIWHFWLQTTDTGWVTYRLAGGMIIENIT